MQANSGGRVRWKLPLGLGLAVLVVAAVVVIPTVASAGQGEAGNHATPAAGVDATLSGQHAAGHHAAAASDALRQDELAGLRQLTARFHSVEAAEEAGYELGYVNGLGNRIITGCVAHPTAGAMGYHYFNKALIDDLVVDVLEPEGMVYAPGPDGKLRLAAVEYVVPGANSNPPGPGPPPPTVFGRDMVILVPAVGFWTLHAWVWRHNPSGMFAHWNPKVTCP